jgi:hypothetical protein
MGSIATLREGGHFDEWSAVVPQPAREELLRLVAGVWVPIETAIAYDQACDAMGLSNEEQARLVQERPGARAPGTIAFRAQWV